MTRAALIFGLLAACHRGPRLPEARGTLILELDAKTPNATEIYATAAEVLRSQTLTDRVVAGRRLPRPDHIAVARRDDSMVLEVTVAATDPLVAEQFCNALMQTYAEYRYAEQLAPIQARRAAIAQQLDDPMTQSRDALMQAQRELDLQPPRNDVRLLDPCKLAR